MLRRLVLLFFIGLIAAPTPAHADQDKRAKLHAKVAELRARRLFEVLGVDQASRDKVAAVLDRYDAKLLPLREQMGAARRELKLQLGSGTWDDAKANKLIDTITSAHAEIHRLERERLGELRKILTPRQMAVAVVRLPEIERSIENKLRKIARQKARSEGKADWGSGDADDDDD